LPEKSSDAELGGDYRMPAVQDLVRKVVDSRRMASQQFHLVVLPEDGHPELIQFDTVDELISKVQELIDTEVSLFPFVGNYMPLTKGPNRFLITPYGSLPLFEMPDPEALQTEEHGYVGPPDPSLPVAKTDQQTPMPQSSVASAPAPEPEPVALPASVAEADGEDVTPTMPGGMTGE
jgi:hypothetical protein